MNEMTRIVVAPESFRARFTTAEFERMCESDAFEDWDIELVDGELERMPPPMQAHSSLQGAVYAQILAVFGAARTFVELGVNFGGNTVFGCDVVVLLDSFTQNRWPKAEDLLLAVEVSKTTLGRDLGMKASRYAAAGVPHYWVVDAEASVIHAYRGPIGARYTGSETIRFGEPLAAPGTNATIVLN